MGPWDCPDCGKEYYQSLRRKLSFVAETTFYHKDPEGHVTMCCQEIPLVQLEDLFRRAATIGKAAISN